VDVVDNITATTIHTIGYEFGGTVVVVVGVAVAVVVVVVVVVAVDRCCSPVGFCLHRWQCSQ
jgi:poly(3-hydroxyalkanoate) synthetase